MSEQLKVNPIGREMGIALANTGFSTIRISSNEITPIKVDIDLALISFKIAKNYDDYYYQSTSWGNWLKITYVLYKLIKPFKWEAEIFDCDDRSKLISSLASLLFKMNTCLRIRGNVYDATTGVFKYTHWWNLIVTPEGNYFFDVDNGGLTTKVSSQTVVMGNNLYKEFNLIN